MASRLRRPILGVATPPRFVAGRRPPMQLTPTFLPLLLEFAGDFTRPTHATFVALMTGWLLPRRHRFITELIQSSGSTPRRHHSRYRRFFSHAAWSLDTLG